MGPYIFGKRNGVHILDLEQTVPMLHQALLFVRGVVAGGGRVLFVGTKRQASEKIADAGKRCGQYYVNHRWLGGMLTNWKTISLSIRRLKELDNQLATEVEGLTKKELLKLTRERDKLERALGGIKEMGGLPDVLFVIDTNKEHIAVDEAKVLKIPVVAVVDSNSNPTRIDYPIPGNDDALRSIGLYCELVSDAVLDGIQAELIASGGDRGTAEEAPVETLPEAAPAKAAEPEPAKAAEPEPAKVAEPEPAKAAEPEPAKAAEPEPAKAAEPEPAMAAEPEPAKVVEAVPAAAPETESAAKAGDGETPVPA